MWDYLPEIPPFHLQLSLLGKFSFGTREECAEVGGGLLLILYIFANLVCAPVLFCLILCLLCQ